MKNKDDEWAVGVVISRVGKIHRKLYVRKINKMYRNTEFMYFHHFHHRVAFWVKAEMEMKSSSRKEKAIINLASFF